MKYAVITVTDGNFLIRSEWSDKVGAIKDFHTLAGALWNDTGFSKGYIAIMDSNLDTLPNYKEYITHELQPIEEDVEE